MLKLIRKIYSPNGIIGELYFNNNFVCNTLENFKLRINEGKYPLEITYSPKFNTNLPEIKNVENRTGIRIHSGNTQADTEGCILVGDYNGNYTLINSKKTLEKLITLIKDNEIREIEIV